MYIYPPIWYAIRIRERPYEFNGYAKLISYIRCWHRRFTGAIVAVPAVSNHLPVLTHSAIMIFPQTATEQRRHNCITALHVLFRKIIMTRKVTGHDYSVQRVSVSRGHPPIPKQLTNYVRSV